MTFRAPPCRYGSFAEFRCHNIQGLCDRNIILVFLNCLTLKFEGKISSETSLTLPIETASYPKDFNVRQHRCDKLKFRNELALVTKRQRKYVCHSVFSKYRLSTSGQSDATARLAHHGETY